MKTLLLLAAWAAFILLWPWAAHPGWGLLLAFGTLGFIPDGHKP